MTIADLTKSCRVCSEIRAKLREADEEWIRQAESYEHCPINAVVPTGFEEAMECTRCKNRGKVLTAEGAALLSFIREFAGETASKVDKEIPF